MTNTKFFSLALSLILVACGSDGDGRDENFNQNGEAGSPQNLPRQSFVVRTNQQTGQAEYAPANFDSKVHPQALANMAEGIRSWQPVQQNQVITAKKGLPSQGRQQIYFVRDPQDLKSQNVHQGQGQGQGQGQNQPLPYSGYDYSPGGIVPGRQGQGGGQPSQLPSGPNYSGNQPSQLPSGPNYGQLPAPPPPDIYWQGGAQVTQPIYYPYCNAAAYANCYGYLPTTYANAWVYWTPYYYYPAETFSYAFYTYSW